MSIASIPRTSMSLEEIMDIRRLGGILSKQRKELLGWINEYLRKINEIRTRVEYLLNKPNSSPDVEKLRKKYGGFKRRMWLKIKALEFISKWDWTKNIIEIARETCEKVEELLGEK
jgi:hypothetical protein